MVARWVPRPYLNTWLSHSALPAELRTTDDATSWLLLNNPTRSEDR